MKNMKCLWPLFHGKGKKAKDAMELQLFLSVRFNAIDAYVRPPEKCGKLQTGCRYEVHYRNKNTEVAWKGCPSDKLARVEAAPGRLCTISNLDPNMEYEVRGSVISENDGRIVAESPIKVAKTKNEMTLTRSYVAIADVENAGDDNVSAIKGDILVEEIDASRTNRASNNDIDGVYSNELVTFANLRNPRTNKAGFLPLSAVSRNPAGDKPCLITEQEYFFQMNRRRAEVWMMRPNVETGRFLIRPSHSEDFMALSVRFGMSDDGVPQVEHFKVYVMEDGYGCYVTVPNRTFEDVSQLIEYYKDNTLSANRQILLTEPFPRNPQPTLNLEELAIPSDKLTFIEKIGQGNFGEVHRARLQNLDVAVKKLLPPPRNKEGSGQPRVSIMSNREELLREAKEMAPYFHDNLVRLIGVCVDKEPYMIITEYMNCGSLWKWLNDDRAVVDIQLQLVVYILGQVACGMAYLEEKRVIHRDLRTANVLVHDENGQFEIKITDFGLTRKIREDEDIYSPTTNSLLPVRWTAPEAYENSEFSTKSDVWSFGVLCYEVFTLGETPFKEKTTSDACAFVMSGGRITYDDCKKNKRKVKMTRSRSDEDLCPQALFDEIARCWNDDPHSRPTFAALSDFLENYETGSNYKDQQFE